MGDAAAAAFARREAGVPVLDLACDSLLDEPGGVSAPVRRLRFAGHGCAVQVDVTGTRRLGLTLVVEPDDDVEVEVRQAEPTGEVETRRRGTTRFSDVPAGLTSLLVAWPGSDRPPMRTAWVRL